MRSSLQRPLRPPQPITMLTLIHAQTAAERARLTIFRLLQFADEKEPRLHHGEPVGVFRQPHHFRCRLGWTLFIAGGDGGQRTEAAAGTSPPRVCSTARKSIATCTAILGFVLHSSLFRGVSPSLPLSLVRERILAISSPTDSTSWRRLHEQRSSLKLSAVFQSF